MNRGELIRIITAEITSAMGRSKISCSYTDNDCKYRVPSQSGQSHLKDAREGALSIISIIAPELEKARKWDKMKSLECEKCPSEKGCYEDEVQGTICPINMIVDALEGGEK
jgi:hypothetical protein